ncbi:Uncharacterized protein (Fragment) [Durusdinium trenchii]|uniref:Cellulase n=1 Tax=Durusdinium trenchii TaxID=1381693 RepID=A0ABP0RXB4_9DINO
MSLLNWRLLPRAEAARRPPPQLLFLPYVNKALRRVAQICRTSVFCRSVKYQNTRCGTARLFYRHAAGAADAANLHTGGRCVLDGGFKRLDLGGGTNLPQGEIYSMGHEAPNHDCDPNDNSAGGCKASFIFNTIADAEACCEQCRSMNWVPLLGGVVETDGSNGAQINPCVAWQVVEGRCRINRKYYYDMYNSGQLIKDALLDNLYPAPGNPGWLVRTRGCGSSMERCNYFSYIYYRELQDSNVHPVGVRSSTNATYRKVMGGNLSDLTENITLEVRASSVQSRHDRRLSLLSQGDGDDSDESSLEKSDGTDVGLVEVYDSSALRSSGDYDIFDEESGPVPLCTTGLISSNSPVALSCSLASSGGRRLREVGDIFFVFTAVGSGYDQVNFQAGVSLENVQTTSSSTSSTSFSVTTDDTAEGTSTSGSTMMGSTTDSTAGSTTDATASGNTGNSSMSTTEDELPDATSCARTMRLFKFLCCLSCLQLC